jgi:hypothetical protein
LIKIFGENQRKRIDRKISAKIIEKELIENDRKTARSALGQA